MNISVDLIKELRDRTLAPLKDCKECLIEAEGDLDKAQELLKKKWIASAGKKWDRETKEGKVAYLAKDGMIAVLRLGCETDFVAKNEMFDDLMYRILQLVLPHETVSFDALPDSIKQQINDTVAEMIAKLGENMKVIELYVKRIPSNDFYAYTHAGSKLLAIVYYNPLGEDAQEEIKKVALQVAAMDPQYLSTESIPSNDIERMKSEFEAEVRSSGKPEAVIPNIVSGKVQKKYSEIVLLEQGYMWDESHKIKNIIDGKAELVGFDRIGFSN